MRGNKNHRVEIMAPAGSFESLAAALRAGADSIYFGVGKLNMRAHAAANFLPQDLRKVARLCHSCGARAYLTCNVVVYDEELEEMRQLLTAAKEAGVDAVIAADMAVVRYAREVGLEVHISVQANVSNMEAVRHYAQYADVIVPARELRLEVSWTPSGRRISADRAASNFVWSSSLTGRSASPSPVSAA